MSENPRWDYLSAWLDIFHEGWRDYLGLFSHASPPVQNTRASPSCSNSSPRKFMSLRCRSARRSSGVKPTSSNLNSWWGHEEALFFSLLYSKYLVVKLLVWVHKHINTPSSSRFTNLTSRTRVTCGNRVTALCGPCFSSGRVGGPSTFLHYTSLYSDRNVFNKWRNISVDESVLRADGWVKGEGCFMSRLRSDKMQKVKSELSKMSY